MWCVRAQASGPRSSAGPFSAVLSAAVGTTSATGLRLAASSPGAKVFADAGCGDCHTLSAVDATGTVGPNLDQLKPEKERVARQVRNGGVGMPSFADKLSASRSTRSRSSSRTRLARRRAAGRSRPASSPTTRSWRTARRVTSTATSRPSRTSRTTTGPKAALDLFDEKIGRPARSRRTATESRTRSAAARSSTTTARSARRSSPAAPSCTSGYYHGILERAFLGIPQDELGAAARRFCADPAIRKTEFIAYQCVHGLGHGLMIYTGYDLPALAEDLRQARERLGRDLLHRRRLHGELPGLLRREVEMAQGQRPDLPVQRRRRAPQVLLLRPGDRLGSCRRWTTTGARRPSVCRKSEPDWVRDLLPVARARRLRLHAARRGPDPRHLQGRRRKWRPSASTRRPRT